MGSSWVDRLLGDINAHLIGLPESTDHVLLILKAHLLIEQRLERLLKKELPNPEAILDNHAKFIHKVKMLESLIPNPPELPNIWELLKELNKIRNELAHELIPENIETKLNDLVRETVQSMDARAGLGGTFAKGEVALSIGIKNCLILFVWYLDGLYAGTFSEDQS